MRAILLGLALTAASVTAALADAAPEPPASPVTITAGANDTNGEASVNAGSHLVVKLTVAGGTGYSWKLANDPAPALALSDQRTEKTAPRIGAPQAAVFDFEAQAAGQAELTFELMPPGAEREPARTYSLSVMVAE